MIAWFKVFILIKSLVPVTYNSSADVIFTRKQEPYSSSHNLWMYTYHFISFPVISFYSILTELLLFNTSVHLPMKFSLTANHFLSSKLLLASQNRIQVPPPPEFSHSTLYIHFLHYLRNYLVIIWLIFCLPY